MCIVGDEVGEDSIQKGDGHIGGTLHVCERKFTHQYTTSKKEKDSTLMGVKTLPGKPLIYCVIFKGVKCYSEIETGIGVAINSFGSSDNQQEFIENNLKRGKTPFEPLTCKGNNFLDVQLVYLKTKYSLSYSMV